MHRSLPGAIRATLLAAALGFGLVAATHAAPPAAAQKARVVVEFKAGTGAATRAAIAAAGGRVVRDLSQANALAVEISASGAAALRRNANVVLVEDDVMRYPKGWAAPKAKRGVKVLPGTAEVEPYGIGMVQADQLSDASATSRKICIIDSGIDGSHEDLQGIPMAGFNLTSSGQWNTDENSHGTHVAGTIAAVDNAVGVLGVLPNKKINLYIVKVFEATGGAASSTVAAAMLRCAQAGANVVSMSLGGPIPARIEQRVADILTSRGILIIAAAGNDGNFRVNYPAGFANVVSVAAVDDQMNVASFSQVNHDVEIAAPGVGVLSTVPIGSQIGASVTVGGSSYPAVPMEGSPHASATGPLADFGFGGTATPGSMTGKVCLVSRGNSISFADKVLNCELSGGVGAIVYNNVPNEVLNGTLGETVTTIPSAGTSMEDGQAMLNQLGQSATVAVFATQDAYAFYDGTSMATPHVSGVAALVWSYFPTCTAEQIRASLNKHALDRGNPGRDAQYGYGIVQAKATYDAINANGCGN